MVFTGVKAYISVVLFSFGTDVVKGAGLSKFKSFDSILVYFSLASSYFNF